MELVAGVDAGGTASRAVIATVHGEIVGRGRAGPGNPLAHGPEAAAAQVAAAVREALGERSPSRVVAATLGIAGPAGTGPFGAALAALGVTAPVSVVGDVVTAFASGSPAPAGAVLVAGTGAIAAAVQGDRVMRTADGLGWLLGDEGSGRWLGLQAVRCAVRNWDTPFAARIAARAGVGSMNELVYWAQALPLGEIGALAPVVCAAAREDDPRATVIVGEAVRCLVRTLDELAEPGPVVLAGGLLAVSTPVRDGVVKVLEERGLAPRTSLDPAAGAAWMAARPISPRDPADLHRALLAGVA